MGRPMVAESINLVMYAFKRPFSINFSITRFRGSGAGAVGFIVLGVFIEHR